jgi:ABC-type transport system involved in multi-copper enzyme maturation permease subunit
VEATDTPHFLKRLFMNPLAVRELRVACRSWKLVIILSAYLLIQGSIFAIWLYVQYDNGMYDDPTSIGSGLFITMTIVLVNVVMLVFPAFSSTAIASEHEKKSFDLLLMTPLAPWEIALGKFFAAALQSSIFIIATVPLFAIANLFGGIDPAVFFAALLVLVLFSIFISFVGVYASSLVKKAIPAVLVTYALAFLIGFVLSMSILVIAVAQVFVVALLPVIANLLDPTVGEGVYYVVYVTVTCAMYCSFLFISTTNRLKPTSHNKSTALRVLWTLIAIIIPVQAATFFLIARTPPPASALGVLVMTGVYLTVVLLVPSLTATAEAPIPSRRVRREMEKMPQGLLNAGGKIFFPGGDRGSLHTAMIIVLGMVLLTVAGWVCYNELEGRLDDKARLIEDYQHAVDMEQPAMTPGSGAPSGAAWLTATVAIAMKPEAELREAVTTFHSHQYKGFMALLVVLALTLFLTGQITWRLTLSGISRSLAGVLAGLLIVVMLVVPYIGQMLASANAEAEDQKIAQFSPIAAGINAITWGQTSGRAAIMEGPASTRMDERADSYQWRWVSYAAAAAAVAAGLLALNLVSRRKILDRVKKMSEGEAVPAPVQLTQEQVQHAIAAVTVPQAEAPMQAPPAAPPDFVQPQPNGLDDIQEIDDTPKS